MYILIFLEEAKNTFVNYTPSTCSKDPVQNGTSQLNFPQQSDIMHDSRFDSQNEKIYRQSFQKTALLPTFSEFADLLINNQSIPGIYLCSCIY